MSQWIGPTGSDATGGASEIPSKPGEPRQPRDGWFCYRKRFELDHPPAVAMARIAVDSKCWLWVNGRLVVYEGQLKRGPTPHDTYFDRVDLTKYLKPGQNLIALLAWYWGRSGFSHKSSGRHGLVMQIELGDRIVGTDRTWRVLRHPAYGNTTEPHPNYRLPEENICFDARKELGPWTEIAFDDQAWPTAEEFGPPPCGPWNELIERPIPLWRFGELRKYENEIPLPRVSDGQPIILNLPANLTISPYLKVRAREGQRIDIRTDNYKGGSEYNIRCEYITKDGLQEFETLAYLNGHEVIYSIPAGVEVLELRYRESRYDTDFVGSFRCDDEFLNTLWLKARNTMNVNMRDSIQDPDRERAQWWGDATIVLGEILHTCDTRGHALIKKAIDNLVDWQKPDGALYSPVPAGNWDKELPGQMLSSIGRHGFWYYYLYTGDKQTIQHAYPAVRKYLSLWKIGDDGLIIHRPGGWNWCDWGTNFDQTVIDNALYYQALGAAIKLAEVAGHGEDIEGYRSKREKLAGRFNETFWNGKEYRSPGYTGPTDDRAQGLAVVYDLAKREYWPRIMDVFAREFHASPYMEKLVLEALLKMGQADAAIARMKKRYTGMVESKLSTLWEGWGIGPEGYGGGSYNHGWAGGPLTLMSQYLAGISPTSPGFATFDVRPQVGPLKTICAMVPTVKGDIHFALERIEDGYRLKLQSPAETIARICPPAGMKAEVEREAESKRVMQSLSRSKDDPNAIELPPGQWEIRIRRQ